MDELIQYLKSFCSNFNFTPTGITCFNPSEWDDTKLSELTHPLGLSFREMKPTILPDGTIKQYYNAKENCMKDEQHMLIVGLPREVSSASMANHLNALIAQRNES
tara:strand:+ start:423 stop:737 length:315 start_codon:yes stop_codon:yes gene_type:complete